MLGSNLRRDVGSPDSDASTSLTLLADCCSLGLLFDPEDGGSYDPTKRRQISTTLHSITSLKTAIFFKRRENKFSKCKLTMQFTLPYTSRAMILTTRNYSVSS
jgi:hypothetical protein